MSYGADQPKNAIAVNYLSYKIFLKTIDNIDIKFVSLYR